MTKTRRILVLAAGVLTLALLVPATPAWATTRYLSDMKEVNHAECCRDDGSYSVDGTVYYHSLKWGLNGEEEYWAEYSLKKKWTTFRTTVGSWDDSSTAGPLHFEFYQDGNLTWSQDVAFGKAVKVKLGVANTLRLKLVVINPDSNYWHRTDAVWGTARVKS